MLKKDRREPAAKEAEEPMVAPLIDVRNATKIYGGGLFGGRRRVTALRDCSLTIEGRPATITAVAGESGSGKSTLAGAVLGFVRLNEGQVLFTGQDVAAMDRRQRFFYRSQVQAIFQDPYAVFNPFYRAEHLLNLVIRRFAVGNGERDARERVEEALGKVGLRGDEVLRKHPHQLSGGQRQRMMVARAYLMAPRLIVADEPVSMVDASLRSMILDIMLRLRDEAGMSFLYVTHDLSTAYQISDEIHVFYRGALVESGRIDDVLNSPKHPYTQLLIESIPLPDPSQRWTTDVSVAAREDGGIVSDAGCGFQPRCPHRMDHCRTHCPALVPIPGTAHKVACHLFECGSDAPRVCDAPTFER
jgi:peptide/nickel transport system ATP-binding protein